MRMVFSPTNFMLMSMPKLRHLPYFSGVYAKLMANLNRLFTFFTIQINEHERDFDPTAEANDFVHAFLKEKHRRSENNEDPGGFHEMQLKNTVFDMWIAGMETTSNTLAWAILYLIHNPMVQKRIHEEFDREIASDRINRRKR